MVLTVKKGIASSIASFSGLIPKSSFYLSTNPNKFDNMSIERIRGIYNSLNQEQRDRAEFVYWELSKMDDPRIDGVFYGKEHFFDVPSRSARSLHRIGCLKESNESDLVEIKCPSRIGRQSTTNRTQYYSLGEKHGFDLSRGYCGFVNGMGCTIGWAGMDASKLSNSMCHGVNMHCVYLPTYTKSKDNFSPAMDDYTGVMMDVTRHLATNGGEMSRSSCLIVQMWIDYLTDNPTKSFLQVCASDGATYVNSALNLFCKHVAHLVPRLNIIALAPGAVILPNSLFTDRQVINILKKEDVLISRFGTGSNHAGVHPNVIFIPHNIQSDHPHNFTNPDYTNVAITYVQNFQSTGFLL